MDPHLSYLMRLLRQSSPGLSDQLCRKRWRQRFWNAYRRSVKELYLEIRIIWRTISRRWQMLWTLWKKRRGKSLRNLLSLGTRQALMLNFKESKYMCWWFVCLISTKLSFRFATQKFSKLAYKFVKDVKRQMGVDIFMLAGFRDSDGVLRKSKQVYYLFDSTSWLTFIFVQDRDTWSCESQVFANI